MPKQRAELTHKHNINNGRHGWLRLTPAYSLKLVNNILDEYSGHLRVFDPFSGTATTTLAAASRGNDAVSVDINPFLIWLGKTKVARYQPQTADAVLDFAETQADRSSLDLVSPADPPPISKIERWWDEDSLLFLRQLRGKMVSATKPGSSLRNLLDIVFCRTLIKLSNAAFNHQSMSFKDRPHSDGQLSIFTDADPHIDQFIEDAAVVARSAKVNPKGKASIILADSRQLSPDDVGQFDLLITSPPYPNRMSYIRELRPYMYWLGFLTGARQAGELDWEAIGGTWGIATSLLAKWQQNGDAYLPDYLQNAVEKVARSTNKNGFLLSRYISKYFVDIWQHLQSVKKLMARGAEVHYIVGNSTFYGVMIPVEEVYADMLKRLGFSSVKVTAIRKRNSKKELFEYVVYGRA
ncbi:MAG: DNA adenine methylase [Phycisphaerae bacterium]|nr:DNA adenine methylase [Phycisphaerae bacterium]